MAQYRDIETGEILTQEEFDAIPETFGPESQRQSFLQRAKRGADIIFGGGKIGEAIGGSAARLGLTGLKPEERQFVSLPKPSQVIADIGQIGLTLGTLSGAGTAGKLGARFLKSAALGAGFGAAGTLKEGGSVREAGKNVLMGGAIGGALPLAGATLGKVGKVISENIPEWLVKSLRPEKDITQHVLQNTKVGTTRGLIERAQSSIKETDTTIKDILTSDKYENSFISKNTLLKSVAQSFGQTGGGGTLSSQEIEKIVLKTAPQARGLLSRDAFSIADANRLRKIIDRTLGARFFLQSQPPFTKDVLGTFNGFLRNYVQTTAKETAPLFLEESKNITLRNALQANQKRIGRIGFYEVGSLLLGYGAAGIPGAAAGIAGERILRSPATTINVAKNLAGLKTIEPVTRRFAPLLRTSILHGGFSPQNNPQDIDQ